MITDLEQYIREGLTQKGATEFMRALSKVCMDISPTADPAFRQPWITLSARIINASDFSTRQGIGAPFKN